MASTRKCKWCGHNFYNLDAARGGVRESSNYCSVRCETRAKQNQPKSNSNSTGLWLLLIITFVAIIVFITIIVAFAPGMVATSLLLNSIETSKWAWIWSVINSTFIFGVIYFLFYKFSKIDKTIKIRIWKIGRFSKVLIYSVVVYVVISGFSIWFLRTSNADSIVKICELLSFSSTKTENVSLPQTTHTESDTKPVSKSEKTKTENYTEEESTTFSVDTEENINFEEVQSEPMSVSIPDTL